MKGAKYTPMDFDTPQNATVSETVYTPTETYRSEPEFVGAAPVYTSAPKKRVNPALFVAAPLALAAVVGGALYLGSNSGDDLTTDEVRIAETDAPAPFTETTDTLPVEVAELADVAPAPIPAPAPVAAQIQVAAATPAPRARVSAARARPAPVVAPSAVETSANVSATESTLPSAPVAYAATGPAAEPAPVAAPTPAPAILNLEPITP